MFNYAPQLLIFSVSYHQHSYNTVIETNEILLSWTWIDKTYVSSECNKELQNGRCIYRNAGLFDLWPTKIGENRFEEIEVLNIKSIRIFFGDTRLRS